MTTDTASQRVTIANAKGLHARASAKFVGAVAELPEGTQVTVTKDGIEAGGGSILGLMMLGAARGDEVEIAVSGAGASSGVGSVSGAEAILKCLVELVESRFGED